VRSLYFFSESVMMMALNLVEIIPVFRYSMIFES
jgi:hypothetical protein